MDTTAKDIIWGPLRSLLEDNFTFGSIKEIIGLAGLDLRKLSRLQQRLGGASKSQLMTGIDSAFNQMTEIERHRFMTITTEEILRRKPELEEVLHDYLMRLGWTIHEGLVVPLKLLDVSELPELPEETRSDLVKAATRLRDGDLSGAISAACGAVDTITDKIYVEKGLGDYGNASFQEKVNKSLRACGVLPRLENDLDALGWESKDIKPFKENLFGSLNQAAYVMQTLRSRMGDVHGTKPILKPLVFDSLKWAALIVRLLKC